MIMEIVVQWPVLKETKNPAAANRSPKKTTKKPANMVINFVFSVLSVSVLVDGVFDTVVEEMGIDMVIDGEVMILDTVTFELEWMFWL